MTNKNTGNITTESDKIPRAPQGERRDPMERAATPGRIAKFAAGGTLTDSIITENAGQIGIGTAPNNAILTVTSATAAPSAIRARNTAPGGVGVSGDSPSGTAVRGDSQSGNAVSGRSFDGLGVAGQSTSKDGVFGSSESGVGVRGKSTSGDGVRGEGSRDGVSGEGSRNGVAGVSTSGSGVAGISTSGVGIYGHSASNYAGYFTGNVHVLGTLTAGGKDFKIDHPLDPTNKTLAHSVVESPDMMNLYNGNTITDAHGHATITLPAYFQALNREFRYQLTVLEQFAQAIVSRKIQENSFTIKTDKPHVEVSWMVTGMRQDAYAQAHPLVVEEEKAADERGAYLHPEAYGQPKTKGVLQALRRGETQLMPAEAAPHQTAALP